MMIYICCRIYILLNTFSRNVYHSTFEGDETMMKNKKINKTHSTNFLERYGEYGVVIVDIVFLL